MKKIKFLYVLFLFLAVFAFPAFAYLDPATGNVLVFVVTSIIGALFYSLKGAYYVIARKMGLAEKTQTLIDTSKIILFCEGKSYWNTFKPLVDNLLERKIPFSYYTTDIEDPGLDYEEATMFAQYLGEGAAAYARLARVEGDAMITTTPNIGTAGFPLPRPAKIKRLIHIFHAIDDIALYHKQSLDCYDEVLMVGDHCTESIRFTEKLRNLPQKKLVSVGLPYLDVMAQKIPADTKTNGKTILLAPSWGSKGFLSSYGTDFIEHLAKEDFDLIIRPHPQSWKVEKTILENLQKRLESFKNITWDTQPDGTISMSKADVLISDTSAVRFDFALLYDRPVITLAIPLGDMTEYECADFTTEPWIETAGKKIGSVITKETFEDLIPTIKKMFTSSEYTQAIKALKSECLTNFGKVGEKIVDYLIAQ
ncbi:MAG: CDP-glycerol glycerophosphotransferase family protein [Treponemataceae bacterium]